MVKSRGSRRNANKALGLSRDPRVQFKSRCGRKVELGKGVPKLQGKAIRERRGVQKISAREFSEREDWCKKNLEGNWVGSGMVEGIPWEIKEPTGTTLYKVGEGGMAVVVAPGELEDVPWDMGVLREVASAFRECKPKVERRGVHSFSGYFTMTGSRPEFDGSLRGRTKGGYDDYMFLEGAETCSINTTFDFGCRGLQYVDRKFKIFMDKDEFEANAKADLYREDVEVKGHFHPNQGHLLFTWNFSNKFHVDEDDHPDAWAACVWLGEGNGGGLVPNLCCLRWVCRFP